jgi:hypothetical protein
LSVELVSGIFGCELVTGWLTSLFDASNSKIRTKNKELYKNILLFMCF